MSKQSQAKSLSLQTKPRSLTEPLSNQKIQTKPTEEREGTLFLVQWKQCQSPEGKQKLQSMWQHKPNRTKVKTEIARRTNLASSP